MGELLIRIVRDILDIPSQDVSSNMTVFYVLIPGLMNAVHLLLLCFVYKHESLKFLIERNNISDVVSLSSL